MGSPIAGIHNLRPEQELEKHTEHPRDHDQFPSARTHPQEHRLLLSLDSPQHVIREHDKTHQRRDLITVPTMAFADCGCFFCRPVISEVKPATEMASLKPVIEQLSRYLAESDAAAVEYLESVAPQLRNYFGEGQFESLAASIENYSFPEALDQLVAANESSKERLRRTSEHELR